MSLDSVKQQYETLPYPPRDPKDENKRLIRTDSDDLLVLNHMCFKGERDFFQSPIRCLVAGGGTGDAVIYLAEQLKGTGSEIVYLDLSHASMSIAKSRAQARGLDTIDWREGSLLDLPQSGLAPFDYINCSGVLHHLPDPVLGLEALTSVLKDTGVIYLMLYGQYGRWPIYLMQALFKDLLPSDLAMQDKIALSRALLSELPKGHPLNTVDYAPEIDLNHGYGDSGLYDLFLHAIDRAYTIEEIQALIASVGFELIHFIPEKCRQLDPNFFIADPDLQDLWQSWPQMKQMALAEKLSSTMRLHQFYIARSAKDCLASIENESLAIIAANEMRGQFQRLSEQLVIHKATILSRDVDQTSMTLKANVIQKACLGYMTDQTKISDIIRAVSHDLPEFSKQEISAELKALYLSLHEMRWAYLGKPST